MSDLAERNIAGISRRLGGALAAASWFVIGLATLIPTAGGHSQVSPWCLACGPGWSADAVANLLLFVPLGAGLAFAGFRARYALLAVALTTLAIELLQLRVVTGRDASLSDLLMNFAGGALGFLGFRKLGLLIHPPPARALALAALWAALWAGGTVTTAWALSPSLPDSLWWGHWRVPADVPLRGPRTAPVTLAVTLAGTPLDRGPVQIWSALRPRMLAGGELAVHAVIAPPTAPRDREIVMIDDADSEAELISLRRAGNGVSYFFRTRAAVLRLRPPSIASGDFLAADRVDTARVRAALAGGRVYLDARGTSGEVSRVLALSPNWGWSFLLPPRYALGAEVRLFTALWIAIMVFPIAFWAAQRLMAGYRPAVRLVTLATVAAPGLAFCLVPPLFGLPWVHWTEWLAWMVSSALGWAAGRLAVRSVAPAGRVTHSL